MKVLITGGCGGIARTLAAELEQRGHELRLLDRQSPAEATVFTSEGTRVAKTLTTNWPFVQAEITDPAAMRQACEGMDAVIHLAAALRGFPAEGIETFKANALGTFIVFDAAHQAGVKRVLCASSINVFGTFYWRLSGKPVVYDKLPLDETTPPVPEDPYSLSKWAAELTGDTFHRAYGMTTASFRFSGVWDDKFYKETIEKGPSPTAAWSDDLFQWVHVRDVATALRQALEEPNLPGCGVYTLGAGDTRCPEPTMEVLKKFRPDLLAKLTRPIVGRDPLLSIDAARRAFGYAPKFRLGS